jgi:hypothetical protein
MFEELSNGVRYFVNPMNFGLSNCSLKIHNFIKIPIPKVGVHLGVRGLIPSHSFAFLGV